MNRINEIGMELIKYKDEYNKDYSEIIINALSLSMDEMVKSEIVDRTAIDLIKNKDITMSEFKDFLLDSEKYAKSEEEIREEMAVIKNDILQSLDENGLNSFDIKVDPKNLLFSIVKVFSIDEESIQKYFGVDDNELGELMKRKGFAEKFAALRMTQVLKEIIESINVTQDTDDVNYSLVYFNEEEDGFNIDLIYTVEASKVKGKEELIDELSFINSVSGELFEVKMQLN